MGVNLSLRSKLLFLTLAVVVCFGTAIALYVNTRVAGDLTTEMLKRGVSIARHVAEVSTEDFIEGNSLHLQYLARGHQEAEADIRYILMVDRAGKLLAHSFGSSFPEELAGVNHYLPGQNASIRRLDTGSEIIYDIAVPVLDGRVGGVRVGISAEPIRLAVSGLIREVLVAILVLGGLAFVVTLPAAEAIARPLSSLTRAIEGLARGQRDVRLPVNRRDEIGVLNDAFNQMAADVRTAQKRLAAQVSFLQVLMDDLPVPVFYKGRDLKMLGCNSAFATFWGKRIDEIVGRFPEQLYTPEDAALHRAQDEECLNGVRALTYEQVVRDAGGSPHDIVFHKAPFRDEEGEVAGIIGVMHDVTLQRAASRTKSEFVSTVAHEFQTPLATILGFSELLYDGGLDEGERREALQLIIRKSETLSQMVDELLDLARLESGRPLVIDKALCDIGELLTEAVEGFRKRIASHKFLLEIPAVPLIAAADRKRLGQVMENLLSNAVKYSGAGRGIHVGARSSNGRCLVTVRDEGVGMSPDQLEHIFDKFYRANVSGKAPAGTGLGLFISRSIIDAHDGEIRISSTLGEGTTVTVSLPLGAGP